MLDAAKEIKKANLIDREIAIDQLQSFVKETEFELLSKGYMTFMKKERKKKRSVSMQKNHKGLWRCLFVPNQGVFSLFLGVFSSV